MTEVFCLQDLGDIDDGLFKSKPKSASAQKDDKDVNRRVTFGKSPSSSGKAKLSKDNGNEGEEGM